VAVKLELMVFDNVITASICFQEAAFFSSCVAFLVTPRRTESIGSGNLIRIGCAEWPLSNRRLPGRAEIACWSEIVLQE